MSEPSENEINRVIAEFMGIDIFFNECVGRWEYAKICKALNFTRSLEALVPVWEGKLCFDPCFSQGDNGWYCHNYYAENITMSYGKTIQFAAAMATYKAIKALEGK